MKPAPWLWLAAGVLALGYIAALAFLRSQPAEATVAPMPTVAKKPAAVRKPSAKRPPRAFSLGYAKGVIRVKSGVDLTAPTYGIKRRALPKAKGTAADVAKLKDFGAGADWSLIEAAHAARDL